MWRIIKKSIKIFVINTVIIALVFSDFPIDPIKNYLAEKNIVDNFYWSAKLSNVMDNFSVKTAYASPGTRSRTVEFFAGQLLATQAGQNTNTQYNFATFNVNLYEDTVSIKNAFVEFEGQIGAYVSETVPGFVLYFDSCTAPCTPTPAAFVTNTGGLGTNSGEEQTLTARADVTVEAEIAGYTGAGATLVAQVGYKDTFATAQATWQSTQARLVITYTYDDASTTQTNTIYYPLESQASGDQGSRGASQASGCTFGTNCPKFNYNIVAPEISSQLSQWFAINGSIAGGSTTTDYQSTVRVDTNSASSVMWFEEALSLNGGGFRYLMSGLTGHTNNAAHYIERTGTPHTLYVMGGEAALTYSYLNAAATKTKTVRYPVGEVQTAANNTTKTALTGPNVYLPESGVDIQKAWFRITTSYGAAADTLAITTKVGNNTETAEKNYSVAPPTQNVTDDNVIYHVIPSADYAELQAATISSPKAVQMTSKWTTGAGAVSAELVITYTYTSESGGYQTTLQAFAGQHTAARATTFTTATGAIDTEMPEANNKQVNGAFLKMSRNKLTASNEAMGAGLTTSTCTATNTSTGESDTENSRISLYKDVTSVITTSDTQTYTACYSAATASTFTGVLVYTYQWAPPVTTISNFVTGEPSSSTIAPAASGLVDSFGLQTNTGIDTVTGATVTLAAGTGARVATAAITDDGDTTTYCSAAPSGDTATLTSCGIPVSTTNTQFKVKITAVSHGSMPVPPGGSYAVTGTVTAFTSTNSQSGTDSGSATVTIDNTSPNGATAVSGSAGNANVTLNWTTSNSGDFNTTSGSVVYRWQSGSAGSETPDEGTTPSIGSADGTATVACVVSSAASTALERIDGSGGSADCTTAALTNGQNYTYKVFQKDTNGNYDVGVLIGTFTPTSPTVITVEASGTQTTLLIIPSTNQYVGGAFTMVRGTGSANVTQIIITENGTVNANSNLSNMVLFYKQEASCSTSIPGDATQYNGTGVSFNASEKATATGTMTVGTSQICVYVRLNVGSGASDGQTMEIRIANPSTEVTVSAGTVSPSTPVDISGTTTLEVPKITVATEGAQTSSLTVGTGDNNVGGAFTFIRNTGSADVTQIIITDQNGTVNANLNLSDVRVYYKQEETCSSSIPVDATLFNSTPGTFNTSEKTTVAGTMAVGTAKICVYVRVDVGDGASNGETLEIEISNPSTEVTVSAGNVTPATAVAISGTTTMSAPTYISQGLPFLYTANNWGTGGSGVSFYLEVYMRRTTGTVYARLYNETDTTAVSGSTLSTTSSSFTRLRTASALTLTDGRTYRVQFGKIGSDAGETLGAKLVVNQNGPGGGGADLAEYYSSKDQLDLAEVVAIDRVEAAGVKRADRPYQEDMLGIVATQPGIILGENVGQSYPIALVGRVPVRVTTENGQIRSGDYLTSAAIPGHAMKATKAGRVLGQALETLDPDKLRDCPPDTASAGQKACGTVLVFVNLIDYLGSPVELVVEERKSDNVGITQIAGTSESQGSGLSDTSGTSDILISSGPPSPSDLPAGKAGISEKLPTRQEQILAFLKELKEERENNGSQYSSEVFTDRVSAVNEVITPYVITDLLIAKKIKADSIEGLEILTDKISSSSATLSTGTLPGEPSLANTAEVALDDSSEVKLGAVEFESAKVTLDLTVNGKLLANGGLTVSGPATFAGETIFEKLVTFVSNVIFRGKVTFEEVPIFSKDTAGFAVITKDTDEVAIVFDKEYVQVPLVIASITLDTADKNFAGKTLVEQTSAQEALENDIQSSDLKYFVTKRDVKGFVVKLNKKAPFDVPFSWYAVSVKDAAIFRSKLSNVEPKPTIEPSLTPSPEASPSAQ